jgi:hypothetical protein
MGSRNDGDRIVMTLDGLSSSPISLRFIKKGNDEHLQYVDNMRA